MIDGVKLKDLKVIPDERGLLMEIAFVIDVGKVYQTKSQARSLIDDSVRTKHAVRIELDPLSANRDGQQ